MTIKPDEIRLVKLILYHCKKEFDPIPTQDIFDLDMHDKRKLYLLNKMTHFIDYGVNAFFGWLDIPAWEIKQIYKNKHGVDLNDN